MSDALAKLRLTRSDNIGPVSYRLLLQRFGSAQAALDALPDLARRGGGTARIASSEAAARELDAVARFGGRFVFIGDADYPVLLANTESAPPALAVKGDIALLDRPCVAIVGARNASAAAVRFARSLAAQLAEAELVVVSGLARGIDAAAHWGALDGGTIAVIAGGIDIAYPPENAELQDRLAADGLLIAEQPFGTGPQARHFPRRNRIIAGLCAGTVVVEGALKSGSLITARLAAEAGREVMAVPGSPLDPRAQGCNALIREGATLVQNAADIVETLSSFAGNSGGHVGGRSPRPSIATTPARWRQMPATPSAPRCSIYCRRPRCRSTNWSARPALPARPSRQRCSTSNSAGGWCGTQAGGWGPLEQTAWRPQAISLAETPTTPPLGR